MCKKKNKTKKKKQRNTTILNMSCDQSNQIAFTLQLQSKNKNNIMIKLNNKSECNGDIGMWKVCLFNIYQKIK